MSEENNIFATIEEKRNAIEQILSMGLYDKLIKYSIYRMKAVFNIQYNLDKGFRGLMIEDIINDVLTSFFKSDGRNWNKSKFPLFIKQLYSSLDSQICNTISKELRKTIITDTYSDEDSPIDNDDNDYQELISIVTEILTDLNATDEEILLFEPYVVNGMKREDIAKLFGISVIDVTNLKKKLDRKLPILKEKIKLRYA